VSDRPCVEVDPQPDRLILASVLDLNTKQQEGAGVTLYRKKPVEVEAMQFTEDAAARLVDWSGATPFPAGIDWATGESVEGYLVIQTLEGPIRASLGDWIIRGIKGEFYPCKPDIFEATYEAVSE
jgi:hypothetical protein